MANRTCDNNLGSKGIRNRDTLAVVSVDQSRGWQQLRSAASNESGLSALTDAAADAVELPEEGDQIMLRAISNTAGSVVATIYWYPPDPGVDTADDAKDDYAGCGSGWYEAITFTTAASPTSKGVGNATEEPTSPHVIRPRLGAAKMAARITTVSGNPSEIMYRVV